MSTHTAREIAEWLVAWADEEGDEEFTPLKLQKMLYYAKGIYMRNTDGVPLFSDTMQAWSHGPVVPDLYQDVKKYGRSPIDPDEFVSEDFNWDDYRDVEESLIETWQRYGPFTAWALRNKTHQESPWMKNFSPNERHICISDADLKEFFCR